MADSGYGGTRASFELSEALWDRFDRTGDSAALDEAIVTIRQAIEHAPSGEPGHVAALSNLGDALRLRFEQASEPADDEAMTEFSQFATEAVQVYQEVLAMRTRLLGSEHPDTLASMNNLAAVLQDQGDLSTARTLHERTYLACQRVLGPDHPSTLATMNNLAAVLQDLGGVDEARQLRGRLHAMRMLGLPQDATVTVVGEKSESQLPSLGAWLNDDTELRGRVRLAQPQPHPGSMGAMANAVAVTLVV